MTSAKKHLRRLPAWLMAAGHLAAVLLAAVGHDHAAHGCRSSVHVGHAEGGGCGEHPHHGPASSPDHEPAAPAQPGDDSSPRDCAACQFLAGVVAHFQAPPELKAALSAEWTCHRSTVHPAAGKHGPPHLRGPPQLG